MDKRFGLSLQIARRNTKDLERGGNLSQERFADLIVRRAKTDGYPTAATIANWESGRGKPKSQLRQVIVAIAALLLEGGGLASIDVANELLALGGYPKLIPEEEQSIQLPFSEILPQSLVPTTKIIDRIDSTQLYTFLSPTAFFARYLEPHRLFHHRLPQVGRRVQINDLLRFVEGNCQIAILPGRGGSGKSKLLHTLCRRLTRRRPDLDVRLVAENVPIKETALNELPADGCLLIVDDANHVTGIEVLLAAARQNSLLKVLLATRLDETDYLNSQARHAGFDTNDIIISNPLPDLDYAHEHRRLARLALGHEWSHYADELASVTRDSPFLTVLGGQLLRTEQVLPSLLVQNNKFRNEVLHRFRDIRFGEIISKLSSRFTKQLCVDMLPLIAVMTPFDTENGELLQRVAVLLGADEVKLKQLLDALVKAGALARVGRFVRIVPDMLSDFILHEACFTSDGAPTGWAIQVYQAVANFSIDVVLRNLAELDCRVQITPANREQSSNVVASFETDLLNTIWRDIEKRFRASSLAERKAWLNRLERIAFMQPSHLWSLVQIARNEPGPEDSGEVSPALKPWLRPTTQDDVLAALGPILRGIACDERFTARCTELLWEMGRDVETKKSYSLSAMETLRQVASYERYKPHIFSHTVLNCCREWINDPNIFTYHHSILEVIAPMVARQVNWTGMRGRWFSYGSFILSLEALRQLRYGALALIERCALSGERRIVLDALHTLHMPISEEGLWELREEDPEEWHSWEEEQLVALKIVSNVAQSNNDPFVCLRIWEELHWQAECGPRPVVQSLARGILEAMPHSFESQFILLMTNKHGHGYGHYQKAWENIEESNEAWLKADLSTRILIEQRRYHRAKEFAGQVIREWIKRYPDPREGFNVFSEWIERIELSGWWKEFWTRGNPFLLQLTADYPSYIHTWCEIALQNPEARATEKCDDMLCELRHHNALATLELVQRFLASNRTHLLLPVASSYSWPGWPNDPLPEEWQVVRKLLVYPDPQVKHQAAEIVSAIATNELHRAIELILEIDVGEDSRLAEKLFEVFEEHRGFDIRSLTSDEVGQVLEKLQIVESINHYHIGHFLLQAALLNPTAVAQLLLERVRHKVKLNRERLERPVTNDRLLAKQLMDDFHGLPESGFYDKKFEEVVRHPNYLDALRLVRDAALSDEYDSTLLWEDTLAELFHTYSLNYCSTSLDILNEWINSGDCIKVRATMHLLGETYLGFYTSNLSFVSNYLHRAQECGKTVLEEIERAMLNCAENGPPRAIASHRGERSNRLSHSSLEALKSVQGDFLMIQFFQQLRDRAREMIRSEMQQEAEEEIYFR